MNPYANAVIATGDDYRALILVIARDSGCGVRQVNRAHDFKLSSIVHQSDNAAMSTAVPLNKIS